MKNQPYSIFNDIIGPVMTGPSSSHTAAPARIGFMTKHILGDEVKEVEFYFDKKGSFAATYYAQGTDRGLVGGLIGYTPDNPRMVYALNDAKSKGISVKFIISEFEAPHPNTVKINAIDKNDNRVYVTALSTGGGMIEITHIDEFKVFLPGTFYELLITLLKKDYNRGIKADILRLLGQYEYCDIIINEDKVLINIKLSSQSEDIYNDILDVIKTNIPNAKIRFVPPVFSVLSRKKCNVPFRNASEMELWAKEKNFATWEAGLNYESLRSGMSLNETMIKMIEIVEIMEASINKGLKSNLPGRIIKACSGNYLNTLKEGKLISTGAMDIAIAWTMAMVEVNSNFGIIVAAPTSGACGTLPGAVLGVGEYLGVSKEEKAKALFAAGAVGLAIAEQATFAAEICGCQAECGAASCMAAAGISCLMGGTVKQSIASSSIALQNVLGMICDSVANLVEVPCLGRNVMGAVNAISSANMVIAGVDEVIPLDEVIKSMLEVGKLMPSELKCTNSGGLAITKTSLDLEKKIMQNG